jgi:hypothetical protein
MSVQYIIWTKPINKKELLEKIPDLRIEHHNNHDWIIWNKQSNLKINPPTLRDKETGETRVDNDNIWELENHGFKNVNYIMDQLVSKFNVLFYTDNEEYEFWNVGETYDIKEGVKSAMLRHGNYNIIDMELGISEVPVRTMEEYLEGPYKNFHTPKETLDNINFNEGEELPL